MAILDYKTAVDKMANDVHEFQLSIYAAAGIREGVDVRGAYVHDLTRGERIDVSTAATETDRAIERAETLVEGMREQEFPAKKGQHCRRCDVRQLCRHCRKRQ